MLAKKKMTSENKKMQKLTKKKEIKKIQKRARDKSTEQHMSYVTILVI